jgi:RimJ/RimL family protein N-acetyltransferase
VREEGKLDLEPRSAPRADGQVVTLRLFDEARARHVVGGEPERGANWARDYPAEGDREAASALLRELAQRRSPGQFGPYEVLEVDRGLVVGGIGFHAPPGRDGTVEVGYGIVAAEANKGYATAALAAMLGLARDLGARRVIARALPTNLASRRVMEKAGMTFTGLVEGFASYAIDL